jgi:hypothetical protein
MDSPISELANPSADMVAAFANASATPPAPVEQPISAPAPEVSAPAAPEAAAVEPGTAPDPAAVAPAVAPTAPAEPDYAAWVKQTYGVEPDAVKAALDAQPKLTELEKQVQEAAAIRELLSDPAKARAFVELTGTDFKAQVNDEPKAVLFAKFKADNPHYNGQAAQIRFEREFAAKYPGFGYEDTDSEAHREDALLVKEDATVAAEFMTGKQAEARKALEAPATAAPAGPSAEQVEADAAKQLQEVESFFTGLEGFDFDVDGQKVAMPITNLQAVKDATLDFGGFITKLATTDGKFDVQKAAMLAYKLTEDIAGHAAKAAKGSAGPVVPMAALVNNPSAQAPASAHPGDRAGFLAALAQTAAPRADLNY